MTEKPPLQFPPGCQIFDPLYATPEYRFATGILEESGKLLLKELHVVLPSDDFATVAADGQYQVEIPYAVRVDGENQIKIRTENRRVDGSRATDENTNENDRDLRPTERTTQVNVPCLETYGSSIVVRTLQQTRILENDPVPTFSSELMTTTFERGTFTLLDTAGVEVSHEDQHAGEFPVLIVSDRKYAVPFFKIAFSQQMRIIVLNKD